MAIHLGENFMKKILNASIAAAIMSSALVLAPQSAQAEVTANFGGVSDYVYRGVQQTGGNTMPQWQGGLDYSSENGFYAGIWGSTLFNMYGDSQISEGIEYDLYAGWNGNITEDFGIGFGVLTYNYTNDTAVGEKFNAFQEVNLAASYLMFSANYDIGKDNTSDTDYVHYALSADVSSIAEGMSLTYGATKYDGETEDRYFDVGYAADVQGFDFTANAIFGGTKGDDSDAMLLMLGLSKSFNLM